MKKLILFIKNPVLGKVKTRLAATIGDKRALQIYQELIHYTLSLTKELDVEVNLFFSDEVMEEFPFEKKHQQVGKDLGERMKNAFEKCFSEGEAKIVIIGTDCAELTTDILKQSWEKLKTHQVVIGPAVDGGYYLLGMNQFYPEILDLQEWSTSNVYEETCKIIQQQNYSLALLPVLRDIDTEEDLITLKK